MADYPDWVLKHKKKGTYINYTNGRYYLYAAHSERVPGTKKVKRISDGYIGRITESEGLIPARDKISGPVEVFDFGLPVTILSLCANIHNGFRRSFKNNADYIMVASILLVLYGSYDVDCLKRTWLCLHFPDVNMNKRPTETQETAIIRGANMINDTLTTTFGDNLSRARFELEHIFKVRVNGKLYLSGNADFIAELKSSLNIVMEEL